MEVEHDFAFFFSVCGLWVGIRYNHLTFQSRRCEHLHVVAEIGRLEHSNAGRPSVARLLELVEIIRRFLLPRPICIRLHRTDSFDDGRNRLLGRNTVRCHRSLLKSQTRRRPDVWLEVPQMGCEVADCFMKPERSGGLKRCASCRVEKRRSWCEAMLEVER